MTDIDYNLKEHADLSVSTAERWFNCPGSVHLTKDLERKETPHMAKGKQAHILFEDLTNIKHQLVCDGNQPCTVNATDLLAERISRYDMLTEEEINIIGEIHTEYIGELLYNNKILKTEYRVMLDFIPRLEFGTCDLCIIHGNCLYVIDYKNGTGISVDAYENKQLLLYAIGFDQAFHKEYGYSMVKMVILQPFDKTGNTIREWGIDRGELQHWRRLFCEAAEKVFANPNYFNKGEWCSKTFCPAATFCPAIKHSVDNTLDTEAENQVLELQQPTELDNNTISNILKNRKIIEDWLSNIAKLAEEKLKKGEHIDGFKLVRSKKHKQWVDEKLAYCALLKQGLKDKDILEPVKLKSPAKILALKNIDKEQCESLFEVPTGSLRLAAEDDKGDSVALADQYIPL